eukprot:COSAG03_NODE_10166_length_667_cov_4.713028_1_plen_150_part_10
MSAPHSVRRTQTLNPTGELSPRAAARTLCSVCLGGEDRVGSTARLRRASERERERERETETERERERERERETKPNRAQRRIRIREHHIEAFAGNPCAWQVETEAASSVESEAVRMIHAEEVPTTSRYPARTHHHILIAYRMFLPGGTGG